MELHPDGRGNANAGYAAIVVSARFPSPGLIGVAPS